ncbi:MAG: hypothetical protein ACJ789_12980 [Thermomicrobiales bacterium]
MRMLYVPLSQQERDALIDLAHAQRRRPQDQASFLIAESLKGRGLLSGNTPNTSHGDVAVSEASSREEWDDDRGAA